MEGKQREDMRLGAVEQAGLGFQIMAEHLGLHVAW